MLYAAWRARVRAGRLALLLLLALLVLLLLHPLPAFADGGAPADSSGSVVPSTALWGLLVGVFSPPLVAIFQQPKWSERTRSLVATGIAIGFGAVTCWADGSIGHGQTLFVTMGAVLVASQSAYRELWSRVGATQAIESATSPGGGTTTEGGAGDDEADPPVKAARHRTPSTTTRARRGGG